MLLSDNKRVSHLCKFLFIGSALISLSSYAGTLEPGKGVSVESNNKSTDSVRLMKSVHWQTGTPPSSVSSKNKVLEEFYKNHAPVTGTALNWGAYRHSNLWNSPVKPPTGTDATIFYLAVLNSKDSKNSQSKQSDSKVPNENKGAPSTALSPKLPYFLGFSETSVADEAHSINELRETVKILEQELLKVADPSQKLESQFRTAVKLSELYVLQLEKESSDFAQAYQNWLDAGSAIEPQLDLKQSNSSYMQAVNLLRSIVNQNSTSSITPEAFLRLGILLLVNQPDNSLLYLDRLIQRYPGTEHAQIAEYLKAEALYAKGKFIESKTAFLTQSKNVNVPLTMKSYAAFKLVWCDFSLALNANSKNKNLQHATLLGFTKLETSLQSSSSEPWIFPFGQQIKSDMVFASAFLDTENSLTSYTQFDNKKEVLYQLYLREARLFSLQAKYDRSAFLYKKAILSGTFHENAPEVFQSYFEVLEKSNDSNGILNAIDLVDRILSAPSHWQKLYEKNEKVLNSYKETLNVVNRLGRKFHVYAQQTNKPESYKRALVAYNVFLKGNGIDKKAYETFFYSGDALASLGSHVEASVKYLQAVRLDKRLALKGRLTKLALKNAIDALDIYIAASPALNRLEQASVETNKEMQPAHAYLLEALDFYSYFFPAEAVGLEYRHRAALLNYQYGNYVDAENRWIYNASQAPSSASAAVGARLSIRRSLLKDDWSGAIATNRRFLAVSGIKETQLGRELIVLLKGSVFQRALVLEKQGNRENAAQEFLKYHAEFPEDSETPKALYNAANNQFRTGVLDLALGSLKMLQTQFPSHSLIPHSLYLSGASYERLGVFKDSASYFENLVKIAPLFSESESSLRRAIDARLAIRDFEKVKVDSSFYLKTYQNLEGRSQVYQSLSKALVAQNQTPEAIKALKNGILEFSGSYPATALRLLGDVAQLSGTAQETSNTGVLEGIQVQAAGLKSKIGQLNSKEAKDGMFLVSTALLKAQEESLNSFLKTSITDSAKLTEQFNYLREKGQILREKYQRIASLGSTDVQVESRYIEGLILEHLSTSLSKAPLPPAQNAAEVEAIRSVVEQNSFPLQDEARQLYLQAWKQAELEESSSKSTQHIFVRLAELQPNEFRILKDDMPSSKYLDSSIILSNETTAILSNR